MEFTQEAAIIKARLDMARMAAQEVIVGLAERLQPLVNAVLQLLLRNAGALGLLVVLSDPPGNLGFGRAIFSL